MEVIHKSVVLDIIIVARRLTANAVPMPWAVDTPVCAVMRSEQIVQTSCDSHLDFIISFFQKRRKVKPIRLICYHACFFTVDKNLSYGAVPFIKGEIICASACVNAICLAVGYAPRVAWKPLLRPAAGRDISFFFL